MAKDVIEFRRSEEFEDVIEEEEDEEEEQIEQWDDWQSDKEDSSADFLCLFCSSRFGSVEVLFDHCRCKHFFDFHSIVREWSLDFYGSFKLINYVRSQVSENKCWCCGLEFQCSRDLQNHLHPAPSFDKDGKFLWEDDHYLKPFMGDDPLLHSFGGDEDEEDDPMTINKEEIMRELVVHEKLPRLCNGGHSILNGDASVSNTFTETEDKTECIHILGNNFEGKPTDDIIFKPCDEKHKDGQLRESFANVTVKEIRNVNEKYFGAYGSFGIHREMLSDKARMDAYQGALLNNPSLINQATVLDVGCGTGILSLFAAQGGASKVIAVEASKKMAAVATQIASDNGLLSDNTTKGREKCPGVINVVQCMVEELDKFIHVLPSSVDVIVSEWMGYCLLYESMLSSVLYARDRWLKPGGAILPDTATIFGAGFGRGGTSIPFWENVYGFDMSCIGKEVMEDSSSAPIVDTIDSREIVTETAAIHSFDLVTMKLDDMDFTSSFELKLRTESIDGITTARTRSCYGMVLWFETGFTSRFCKEMPTNLSTSPYSPKTHWSQTILMFREPIVLSSSDITASMTGAVGTEECPAVAIRSRISIARSSAHRSIDVSLEPQAISSDGRKRSWPVQIFNL
ncbi:probable protein arginine N-methyltransferase 3 [Zingiber officinale]|uniref:probable protein arginine N-methyltransferase 3 n=1 Tax=Zingiber officinale TaxID=94328 RepID=UPI001C4D6EF4|nr:probable protein arginine N-methyltransferase 3 [Zingiber officinale]XP_042383247.1 probable protein arginine N-methyltransferase 3 [Zingiber officinale]